MCIRLASRFFRFAADCVTPLSGNPYFCHIINELKETDYDKSSSYRRMRAHRQLARSAIGQGGIRDGFHIPRYKQTIQRRQGMERGGMYRPRPRQGDGRGFRAQDCRLKSRRGDRPYQLPAGRRAGHAPCPRRTGGALCILFVMLGGRTCRGAALQPR